AGEATFVLAPRSHTVEASVEASFAGLTGTWESLLPVTPGAMWLDPASLPSKKIRVESPTPRDTAYATLATPTARLWGGVVSLSTDERGNTAGAIDWPLTGAPPSEAMWLTIASDPRASGAGTVGWPIFAPGPADERPFRDWLLLDGMPMAERRDGER